ncbi:MAG: diguanylate cyclase, partial [Spirochaetales bacterium]|nr:diguanylate cyclase [Spirochaetales bacterium]
EDRHLSEKGTQPSRPEDSRRMVNILLEPRIRGTAEMTDTRYTVISPDGNVQFDSSFDVEELENLRDKPEVASLLEEEGKEFSLAVRKDEQTGLMTIYQAMPLMRDGQIIGITRVSQPYKLTRVLYKRIKRGIHVCLFGAILIITAALIPITQISTSLVGSLEQTAQAIADGNFTPPRPGGRVREFRSLVAAMDSMAQQLKVQFHTIEAKNRELKEQSMVDELTGLHNRRYFNEKLTFNWWLCLRGGRELSFMIMDIDKFKQFNDTLGHPAGDDCLREVSRILSDAVHRRTDILARLGGEEFGILLPETSVDKALHLAQKILERFNEHRLPHPASDVAPHVTISIGLATLIPSREASMSELMERADKALYQAKEKGRNRCVVYEGEDYDR